MGWPEQLVCRYIPAMIHTTTGGVKMSLTKLWARGTLQAYTLSGCLGIAPPFSSTSLAILVIWSSMRRLLEPGRLFRLSRTLREAWLHHSVARVCSWPLLGASSDRDLVALEQHKRIKNSHRAS